MNQWSEPGRELPVVSHADVVVCGAGPAGVTAAIAAARTGASTVLIEAHGALGGVWTSSLLSHIIDADNKPGIMAEILDRLKQRNAQVSPVDYDVESMKLVLERLCLEAGVQVRLHSRVVAAGRDDANRLAVAITESKSGREAWAGRVFIDATGDGDLASVAGCGFDLGRDSDGKAQPMTLMALIGGLDAAELDAAGLLRKPGKGTGDVKQRILEQMEHAGVSPSYTAPTLFHIRDDLYAMMANHQYGVPCHDADAITRATLEAREELNHLVDALRAVGGPWRAMRIVATAEQIGVREGRRIRGRYTLTQDDLVRGARFDDAVCRATFCVDVHAVDPSQSRSYSSEGVRAKPYDIPLRSLIARDVDGLMMAGRCISGDFIAHSSYRVTGNAVAMGQAAGRVAARAAQTNRLPHDVRWQEVAGELATTSADS